MNSWLQRLHRKQTEGQTTQSIKFAALQRTKDNQSWTAVHDSRIVEEIQKTPKKEEGKRKKSILQVNPDIFFLKNHILKLKLAPQM